MNILFLTLLDFNTICENGIYTDLMREFAKSNHQLYIISPTEKRKQKPTSYIEDGHSKILKLQIGNIQKTNIIEKGFSMITLETKFIRGIKTFFSNVKFDLVIYSTPPITLQRAIQYVKDRDKAGTYLLLKDIFPQNAVDLGMLKKTGLKSILYKFFRNKEKKLYKLSDYIGCMSPANVNYVIQNNPELSPKNIEVCPNSIELLDVKINYKTKINIKEKYKIPTNKTVFIYGGNLGKPQGIDFLIDCLRTNKGNNQAYFIIVGSGTEYNKMKYFFDNEKPNNALLLSQLPKNDYEILVSSCDVGLIFLDYRFTIPNFPSRVLSYMQASMPVLAATDVNTDIGKIIETGNFGFWCESNNVLNFNRKVQQLCDVELRQQMGINARKYLEDNYTVKQSYEIIMNHFKGEK